MPLTYKLSTKPCVVTGKIISLPAGKIFLNPSNGSWVRLNSSAINLIGQLDGKTSVEQIIENYDSTIVEQCLETLWSADLLEIDGTRKKRTMNCNSNGPPYYAMLTTTNKCNMKCAYCYKPPNNNQEKSMNVNIANKIISEMMSVPTQLPLIVAFHGGEPLLEIDNILKIIKQIKNMEKNRERKTIIQIQTNGTLITNEIARVFQRNNVYVGLSIDGNVEDYNSLRKYNDGKSTFNDAMRGLEILQHHNIPCSIITVVNSYNVDHLEDIFRFFADKGITKMNFIPVHRTNNARFDDFLATSDQLLNGYVKLIEELIRYNKENEINAEIHSIISIVSNLLRLTPYSMCGQSPCGAGSKMLSFDTNGDVYPCDNLMGSSEYKFGNIYSEGLLAFSNHPALKRILSKTVDENKICSICDWKKICNGGSLFSSCSPDTDTGSEAEYCSFYQGLIKYLINILIEGVKPSFLLPSNKISTNIEKNGMDERFG